MPGQQAFRAGETFDHAGSREIGVNVFSFRHHRREVAAPSDEVLVGLAFDGPHRANEFLLAAHRLAADGGLVVKDAAVVAKRSDGRSVVRELTDPTPLRAGLVGAFWCGLIGMVGFGSTGWLGGLVLGAAAGALVARLVDRGIPDEWIGWFKASTSPGTATVALLAADLDRNALVDEVARFRGARLVHTTLDAATQDRLRRALGEPVSTGAAWPAPAAGEVAR